MKMKMGDVLVHKDSDIDTRYGTGVVVSISSDEYGILWSGRGLARYRRAIVDDKLERVFERVERTVLPKERRLRLGGSKDGIPFNENYDRERMALLCESLKNSGSSKATDVADGLKIELFTKKLALRGAAKTILLQLAELCSPPVVSAEARDISRELFFGYVLQESDFFSKPPV
jgi:hypothetical protein